MRKVEINQVVAEKEVRAGCEVVQLGPGIAATCFLRPERERTCRYPNGLRRKPGCVGSRTVTSRSTDRQRDNRLWSFFGGSGQVPMASLKVRNLRRFWIRMDIAFAPDSIAHGRLRSLNLHVITRRLLFLRPKFSIIEPIKTPTSIAMVSPSIFSAYPKFSSSSVQIPNSTSDYLGTSISLPGKDLISRNRPYIAALWKSFLLVPGCAEGEFRPSALTKSDSQHVVEALPCTLRILCTMIHASSTD